ncbi:protein timeless isoform X1 [Octopus bimaculoides]|uniref:protein timeless isoform X1 n=1 Tax=Octopus bimaculoides TaxID=37653 RepID=UPI0022E0F7EA|nr:protein timeless isoform X1 [Octopus bimaculoides]XP_052826628.1 protein timeless isoform X1 [Octopus bimaculoides]
MEWNLMNVDGIRNIHSGLGCLLDNEYIIADECEETLQEIISKLKSEDSHIRSFRRQKNIYNMISTDIIPILKSSDLTDDLFVLIVKLDGICCGGFSMPSCHSSCESSTLFKVLTELTEPIECLFPNNFRHESRNTDVVNEIINHLQYIKLLFCQQESLDLLFSHVKPIIQKAQNKEFINQFLLLMRNLLYVQVWDRDMGSADIQCKFIKNMFECGLDEILLTLLIHPSRFCWSVNIVQLLSLLYTDKIVLGGLNVQGSRVSDEVLFNFDISEVMSVFIETDRNIASLIPIENSNRSQLVTILNSFNSQFLLLGFAPLVSDLKEILLSKSCNLDGSYFMWLLIFFLKMARIQEMDFSCIREVVTVDIIGFLVYQGIDTFEELVISNQKKLETATKKKRLHFTVASIKEILKTIEVYDSHLSVLLSKDDVQNLENLKCALLNMTDLRQMFLLLIRSWENQSYSFLRDLIVTNHTFLLLLDQWHRQVPSTQNFEMIQHINQFSTIKVMQRYGFLLEKFNKNSPCVNDSIFTMMHHVAGDCKSPEVLMQMPILKLFTDLCDDDKVISNEASDVMEYVMHKFMVTAAEDPSLCAKYLFSMEANNINIDLDNSLMNDYKSDVSMCSNTDFSPLTHGAACPNAIHLNDDFTDCEKSNDKERDLLEKQIQNINIESVVPFCIEKLHEKKMSYQLLWLQTVLLETYFVKYVGTSNDKYQMEEPIPLYYSLQNRPVPLIPYNGRQEAALEDCHFQTLLKYLGFYNGSDSGRIFPHIPAFWTIDQLMSKAEEIGPLNNAAIDSRTQEALLENQPNYYQEMQLKRIYTLHTHIVSTLQNGDWTSEKWIHRLLSYNRKDIERSEMSFKCEDKSNLDDMLGFNMSKAFSRYPEHIETTVSSNKTFDLPNWIGYPCGMNQIIETS